MIYKLSFLTLIILGLSSCGSVETSTNPRDDDTLVTCKQKNNTISFKKTYSKIPIKIEAPSGLKLLIVNKPTSIEKTTFDKTALYNLFKTEYFWADETPKNFDVTNYSDPQRLINDLKYKDDRWSFAVTPEVYNSTISQKSIGIGFSCHDIENGCLITYVRLNSPADKIDLRRGDIIQTVNEQPAIQALIYAKGQEEKQISFKLSRPNKNQLCQGKVIPREYSYDVVASKVLQTPLNKKVGYLRLDSFLGDDKILPQLNTAFNSFKKESIDKLIIDLRYNGGGSVDLASKLLDKLSVNQEGQTQFTLAWNETYKKKNSVYVFNKTSNALDLKQILFLTTQSSASASELIISAMQPYLPESDVVIIGDKTHGKPVGMSGQSDGSYYYFLINFVVQNSLGFYDYFEGIPVTSGCNIADDPFHEMDDKNEAMLKSALLYVDEGRCK
jgi:C-terminal processing protease CtpA/Prc